MSAHKRRYLHLASMLAYFVVVGLLVAGLVYFACASDKIEASNDIWDHFKGLSVIVMLFFFGSTASK